MGLCIAAFVLLILVTNWNDMLRPYSINYRLIHDIVGIFVVVVGVNFLSKMKRLRVPKFIYFFDKWSFHIFLVHFVIMCGPFSMAYLTEYMWLNIMIMLMTTAVATFVIVKCLTITEMVADRILSKKRK